MGTSDLISAVLVDYHFVQDLQSGGGGPVLHSVCGLQALIGCLEIYPDGGSKSRYPPELYEYDHCGTAECIDRPRARNDCRVCACPLSLSPTSGYDLNLYWLRVVKYRAELPRIALAGF